MEERKKGKLIGVELCAGNNGKGSGSRELRIKIVYIFLESPVRC